MQRRERFDVGDRVQYKTLMTENDRAGAHTDHEGDYAEDDVPPLPSQLGALGGVYSNFLGSDLPRILSSPSSTGRR